jgi:hypothetical protein
VSCHCGVSKGSSGDPDVKSTRLDGDAPTRPRAVVWVVRAHGDPFGYLLHKGSSSNPDVKALDLTATLQRDLAPLMCGWSVPTEIHLGICFTFCGRSSVAEKAKSWLVTIRFRSCVLLCFSRATLSVVHSCLGDVHWLGEHKFRHNVIVQD